MSAGAYETEGKKGDTNNEIEDLKQKSVIIAYIPAKNYEEEKKAKIIT